MENVATFGRRERRRRETRLRLFETAMQLFAAQGFDSTTVEQITEAADVAKGTFFNYFASKEDVLLGLLERQRQAIEEGRKQAETAASVRPILERVAHGLATATLGQRVLLRNALGKALAHDALAKFMGEQLLAARQDASAIMARGQELGELRADWPAAALAQMLQQAVFGAYVIWSLATQAELEQALGRSLELFWAAAGTAKQPLTNADEGGSKQVGAQEQER